MSRTLYRRLYRGLYQGCIAIHPAFRRRLLRRAAPEPRPSRAWAAP